MIRRALLLLILGSALGVLFATFLGPQPAAAEEAPPELKSPPAQPTRAAKDVSRPIIEATKRVRPAVVRIRSFQRHWTGRFQQRSSGSGIIISKQGHILTNSHVADGEAYIVETHDGRKFENTKVLGRDPSSDVAVLRILDLKEIDLPVATLGDSDKLEVGEIVVAIGSPFNLDSSVSMGVVSATGRTGVMRTGSSEEFIQTDAALNMGNSGGPLINLDGHVVGINTAIHQERGGGNIGIGFAVPINLARTVALSLIEVGFAKRGQIGIEFRYGTDMLSRRELAELGIDAQSGIRIVGVGPGSPAARAGLKKGDIVTAIDGRPITDVSLLNARLAQAGPGGNVKLTVHKPGGGVSTIALRLEERVLNFGIEVKKLSPARAAELGLPSGTQGAVVTRIVDESIAARADERNRLLPGDVIQQINTRWERFRVNNAKEFHAAMAKMSERPPAYVQFFIRTKEGRYKVGFKTPRGRS